MSAGSKLSDAWNRAVDASFKENDRAKADKCYAEALNALDELEETGPYEMAWRAMVLYNRGVNLLRFHGLEACSPIPEAKWRAAKEIRTIWFAFMEAVKSIDPDFLRMFQQKHGFNAGAAMNSVRNDPIYRGTPIKLANGMLIPFM